MPDGQRIVGGAVAGRCDDHGLRCGAGGVGRRVITIFPGWRIGMLSFTGSLRVFLGVKILRCWCGFLCEDCPHCVAEGLYSVRL